MAGIFSTVSIPAVSPGTNLPRSGTKNSGSCSRGSTCCRGRRPSRTSSCPCSTTDFPLVNGAPIILADEPTGNLDTKTSVEIMELFVKLNRESNITIILVTHEPDIAAYSKRKIKFLDGRIVSDEVVKKI